MAENILDVGPPNPKRPKLNSPALSASDGPGKGPAASLSAVTAGHLTSKSHRNLSCVFSWQMLAGKMASDMVWPSSLAS